MVPPSDVTPTSHNAEETPMGATIDVSANLVTGQNTTNTAEHSVDRSEERKVVVQ